MKLRKIQKIDKNTFLRLVTVILRSNYFKQNGKYYKLKLGTAIGLPGSPIKVDLVMEDLLDSVIELLGYDPLLCVKYVDDLL